MYTIIRNGLIVDGLGGIPFQSDLLLKNDVIQDIGEFSGIDAILDIDAEGLVVSPGFIDGHTHSDLNVIINRQQPHALYQGVSTIVVGQCGLGFAPMRPEHFDDSIRVNSGIFGDERAFLDRWAGFGEYLNKLNGTALNVGANVTHNAIRQYISGFKNEILTAEKIEQAANILDLAFREGALGFSVGLSYYPSGYSSTEELIELCRVVKKHDAVFCVHLRLDDGQIPLNPVEEIVEVVAKTGVKLNMLHYRTSGNNTIEQVVAPFENLIKQGMDINFEYYPYLVGAGLVLALLPAWAQEDGFDAIMQRLTDKEGRAFLLKSIEERLKYFFTPGQRARIILTANPYDKNLGMTIDEIAVENKETVSETIVRLLFENELEVGFEGIEFQSESLKSRLYDEQYELFNHSLYTVGSDTIPTGVICHPRAFATFPRILTQMRNRHMPIERVIPKITSQPARIYNLKNRGTIEKDKKGDICIFDQNTVIDNATFDSPRKKSDGIVTVIVNGLPAMLDGTLTGILAGKNIKRGQ